MPIDTAHVHNVGEFYSQHYLDAVLPEDLAPQFKAWRAREKEGGARTPAKALASLTEPYFKARAAYDDCPRYAGDDSDSPRVAIVSNFHAHLLEALGYTRAPTTRALPDGVELPLVAAYAVHGRPHLWVLELPFPGSDDAADPLGEAPLGLTRAPAMRALLDGTLLRQEHPPRWVLLLAGPDLILVDRHKWALGQHLRFDLGAMLGARKPGALEALAGLCHREVLLPEGGRSLLDQIDEKSHKHAFAVSTDLKQGVQRAIERIGNEAVHYMLKVRKEKTFERPELAQELARECVTYLYRLLFLFYVEARGGDVGVVPMKADPYRQGLSLEALRDLELVPLHTERARNGFYLHHSLQKLFEVVHLGWPVKRQLALTAQFADAVDLQVEAQRSPLFDRERTPILSAVKLRNFVLQEVIALLSLSSPQGSGRGRGRGSGRGKGRSNKQRGRISYAQLGINQLGAVYEGLLSYTGFFTQEDTFEVQSAKDVKAGDDDARVFYVPASEAHAYEDGEFRTAGAAGKKIVHKKGSFLFRLAGRDREKSASFYTPEVLTRCLTKYTLKERLGEAGADSSEGALTADAILELTVCEPAMGSGAFLSEAVTQLAHAYLERKQAELGRLIPAEDYARELQKVKYHFVVHNCYGVDLNPLAAELGKVSLWLGVLQPGVQAPYLDARLAVGDSLVGARRAVFAPEDLTRKPNKKTGAVNWLAMTPTRVPPGSSGASARDQAGLGGHVYHFLLPDAAMAAYEKDKVVKKLWPEAVAALKQWRKAWTQPLTPMEVQRAQALSEQVDQLWAVHLSTRRGVLARLRQPITASLWGQPDDNLDPSDPARDPNRRWKSVEESELIARELQRPGCPTRRLRAVMDAWCALWTWPLDRAAELPTRAQWFEELEALLQGEGAERGANQRCFHWELEFAEVFAERGGFDVILGNPPWIKLEWQEAGILGDLRPTLALRKLSAKAVADERAAVLEDAGARGKYLTEFCGVLGTLGYLNAGANYPLLKGVQTNLYKCFLTTGWRHLGPRGFQGMIHQAGIMDDPKGGPLRAAFSRKLRSVIRYKNELLLFPEIANQRPYAISVLGSEENSSFHLISNLLHPATLDGSFEHDGHGPVPGIKDDEGNWDLRPHASRIVQVDAEALTLFAQLYDAPGTPPAQARLPVVHSRELLAVLRRFADAPRKLADLEGEYFCSEHFHETNQQKDGTIRRETRFPSAPGEWVVSGPHFYVGTPFNKTPNEGCLHNKDYSAVDLTQIPADYLPRTNYVPACSPAEYRERTPTWRGRPVTEFFRHVHREMVAPTGERTMAPAILPPGAAHVHTVFGIVFDDETELLSFTGTAASIPIDFFVKSTGMGHINKTLSQQLAMTHGQWVPPVHHRTLALNCLTTPYAPLWDRNLPETLLPSAKPDPRTARWDRAPRAWSWDAPLRTPFARRQALVELDALAALSLGLSVDELLLLYRVQFPVLRQYEAETFYDRRGKIVFTVNRGLSGVGVSRKQWQEIQDAQAGDALPEWARDAGGAFEAPFDRCDREADMSQAYGYFRERLGQGEER